MTPSEVSRTISLMNNSKSVGPNSIPIPLLKILKDSVSEPLSFLVNESFTSGVFPDKLRVAQVTLKRTQDKIRTTTDQYQFYLFLVKYSKELCINA